MFVWTSHQATTSPPHLPVRGRAHVERTVVDTYTAPSSPANVPVHALVGQQRAAAIYPAVQTSPPHTPVDGRAEMERTATNADTAPASPPHMFMHERAHAKRTGPTISPFLACAQYFRPPRATDLLLVWLPRMRGEKNTDREHYARNGKEQGRHRSITRPMMIDRKENRRDGDTCMIRK